MTYTASNAHTCPNAASHTPQPTGYLEWQEDCERREARGEVQTQCPACGLWAIWRLPDLATRAQAAVDRLADQLRDQT